MLFYSVLFIFPSSPVTLAFTGSVYTSGTAISSGIVEPLLLIGALYGRVVGLVVLDLGNALG